MIPEEMYQTLDETSLEHWVMELPEDEAKCEWYACGIGAAFALVLVGCPDNVPLCRAHASEGATDARAKLASGVNWCTHGTTISSVHLYPI